MRRRPGEGTDVSKTCQLQGIGEILLVAAMEKCLDIIKTAGGIGLFVDAKNTTAYPYYEKFGFISLPSNELELFLPIKTILEALSQTA